MSFPARPTRREVRALAHLVLEHGKPFVQHLYHDGDVESGPFSTEIYGYRWGSVKITFNGARTAWLTHPTQDHPFVSEMDHYIPVEATEVYGALMKVRRAYYDELTASAKEARVA